ncbi:hypothetical protein PR048_025457 [Dryococelus australis]|uniref:Uncharacterized protein n=1 Tax=Dryococelus australis TaxID=614101 RepID=A0ABQ9GRC0_9NEOP|nr:hypothetical protein PR048_025457 [Dryococelus australis]
MRNKKLFLQKPAVVVERLDCSPPTKANRDPRPGHFRIFASGNRVGCCNCSAGFLGDLMFPTPLHFGVVPLSPHFSLIGSQDLPWLHYSPPTWANRALFPAESLPEFRTWESCRTISLVSGFTRPRIPALLHPHFTSTTPALKTLVSHLTKVAQSHCRQPQRKHGNDARYSAAPFQTPVRVSSVIETRTCCGNGRDDRAVLWTIGEPLTHHGSPLLLHPHILADHTSPISKRSVARGLLPVSFLRVYAETLYARDDLMQVDALESLALTTFPELHRAQIFRRGNEVFVVIHVPRQTSYCRNEIAESGGARRNRKDARVVLGGLTPPPLAKFSRR